MKSYRSILLLFAFILSCIVVDAQRRKDFYDGPYITELDEYWEIKWIERGKKKKEKYDFLENDTFSAEGLPIVDLNDLSIISDNQSRYDNVSKVVSISDIHGQYDIFYKLLSVHGVINTLGDWSFGDGHLVVVGDIFDRGDKVTEILWLLFKLEKQAQRAGGKVHVLLGNHELLVLHGNLNYLHPKYQYTAGKHKLVFSELFDEHTVLGKWLRSKNVSVVVNDVVYVHGGFTKEVLEAEKSLSKINEVFKREIVPAVPDSIDKNDLLGLLYFDNGPLWYRGYANPDGFDVKQVDEILDLLNAKSIVVGHTSMPKILTLQNNKIFLIDSSIKFGKHGEMLYYEKENWYRAKINGQKLRLDGDDSNLDGPSPFEYVYDLGDGDLRLDISTNMTKLISEKMDEEYQSAKLTAYHNEEYNREWNIRVRARGNMRKKFCKIPPVRIDFSKKALNYVGFSDNDKLKVVLPCDDSGDYQQSLYREYMIYKMYGLIDTCGIRARLVNFKLQDQISESIEYDFTGMILEDEANLKERLSLEIIKDDSITTSKLNRGNVLKMSIFQYMIRNIDWTIAKRHNIVIVKNEDGRLLAIPYDFDFAGIVDNDYVSLPGDVPLNELSPRFFRIMSVSREELMVLAEFFRPLKDDFIELIESSTYLNDDSKDLMKDRINKFYKHLLNDKKWDEFFIRKNDQAQGITTKK